MLRRAVAIGSDVRSFVRPSIRLSVCLSHSVMSGVFCFTKLLQLRIWLVTAFMFVVFYLINVINVNVINFN